MSNEPDAFRRMFASAESHKPPAFDEPPVRGEMVEPPIRFEEPPPSKQEIEAAAAEELLKIAAEDEKELQNVRKAQRDKDSFVICCPKGCRIRVKEQHRGRTGKCPRCQSEFVIPKKVEPNKT